MSRQLPALEPNRELVVPPTHEKTLGNGLTVIVVERHSVPLVELRLRVPIGGRVIDPGLVARSALLSQTLLSGTATMSTVQIAAALQEVGGGLHASADTDRLLVTGNGLASGLPRLLAILADVITGATYPADEVTTERARLLDRLQVARSQPQHLVREALNQRIYGGHPYAVQTPTPSEVAELGTAELAQLHAARVRPEGALLVIVGDVVGDEVIAAAEAALGGWTGASAAQETPALPALSTGPLVLVDRPGSVQSSIRLALPGVPRTDPDYPALFLANLVFGGYFSSRWTENIREDKGYTYGSHSAIDHSVAGSTLLLSTEVATAVTAPALLETWYELGRIATVAPRADELEQARQYALGTQLLQLSTQAGLAGLAVTYAAHGLRLDFLPGLAARLASATLDDVAAAAARYLAPAKAVAVVLGDAAVVGASLSTVATVSAPEPAGA